MRAIACALLLAWLSLPAHAATNLAQICTDAQYEGQQAQTCINGPLAYNAPGPSDLVLTRPAGSTSEWAADTIWRKRSNAIAPMQIRTCSTDLTPPALHGGINGTYVGDPCATHVWITAPPLGADVTVTCTAPTQNTDSSPIAGAQLPIGFFFWEGLQSGTATNGVYRQVTPMVTGCNYVFPNLEPGMHYFVAETVDATGVLSGPSNEASKMVPAPGQPIPLPPSGLTVPASQPLAYTFPNTDNALIKLAIGTAKPGAVCHNDWVVNGYQRVDVADVNLSPGVSAVGIAAFTTCN